MFSFYRIGPLFRVLLPIVLMPISPLQSQLATKQPQTVAACNPSTCSFEATPISNALPVVFTHPLPSPGSSYEQKRQVWWYSISLLLAGDFPLTMHAPSLFSLHAQQELNLGENHLIPRPTLRPCRARKCSGRERHRSGWILLHPSRGRRTCSRSDT